MKAEVVSKSAKEHVVILNGHKIETSKHRFDADLHANVINNALKQTKEKIAKRFESLPETPYMLDACIDIVRTCPGVS